MCGGPYEEVTDDVEDWIGCDGCEQWLHWVCAGITEVPESFLCTTCKHKQYSSYCVSLYSSCSLFLTGL